MFEMILEEPQCFWRGKRLCSSQSVLRSADRSAYSTPPALPLALASWGREWRYRPRVSTLPCSFFALTSPPPPDPRTSPGRTGQRAIPATVQPATVQVHSILQSARYKVSIGIERREPIQCD